MPIADKKKAQTIRNQWYLRVAKPIQEAKQFLALIRAAIVDNNLAGEFTQGERDAMLAAEIDLGDLEASAGVTGAEGKYVPTHRSRALIIEGVNDNG